MTKKLITLLGAFALSTQLASADDDDWHNYSVTIKNGSIGHYLTPPLVVAHNRHYNLFNIGSAASDGLALQAETGDPSELKTEADGSGMVYTTAVGGGVIPPGATATIQIMAPRHSKISVTSMLAGTNDAVVAIRSVNTPRFKSMHKTIVIDAGSEMNNEACTHIPGPPCAAGSGNDRTNEGEGMVHFHTGVHGVGDLDPAMSDWRDAIATVNIKRSHK